MRSNLAPQGSHRITDTLDNRDIADIIRQKTNHTLQHHHIRNLPSTHHIFQHNGIVQAQKVFTHHLTVVVNLQYIWERSVLNVSAICPFQIHIIFRIA